MEALLLLINALRPTRCPVCDCDLQLSPNSNVLPRFERVETGTLQLNVVVQERLFASAHWLRDLGPAMEQLAQNIADSGKTKCAEMPVRKDDNCSRSTDPESGLSLHMWMHAGCVRFSVLLA